MNDKYVELPLDDIKEKIEQQLIVPVIGINAFEAIDSTSSNALAWFVRELLAYYKDRDLHFTEAEITEAASHTNNVLKCMTHVKYLFQQKGCEIGPRIHKFLKQSGDWDKHIRLKSDVRDFLRNGRFPLIITTTFLPINLGDRYVPRYYHCAQKIEQDLQIENGKIKDQTIFYLLGDDHDNGTYSENDFLRFLHPLQDSLRCPSQLINYLSDRYVMTIGCEIPDWTFRFLLYSLQQSSVDYPKTDTMVFHGASVQNEYDGDLDVFLDRINYLKDEQPCDFLRQINTYIGSKPTLFLSYTAQTGTLHYETILRIKEVLETRFIVWFFPNQKSASQTAGQYWTAIENGIRKCDFFMPVITSHLLNRINKTYNNTGPVSQDLLNINSLKDKEDGFVTEWRIAELEYQRRVKQEPNTLFSIPYIVDEDEEDINVMVNKIVPCLRDLFYPPTGCNFAFHHNFDVNQLFAQLSQH